MVKTPKDKERNAFRERLTELGYDLSDEMFNLSFTAFK